MELWEAVRPGDETFERLTAPVKPFKPVIIMVLVPDWPALKVTGIGTARMVKSTMRTFMAGVV